MIHDDNLFSIFRFLIDVNNAVRFIFLINFVRNTKLYLKYIW